MAKTFLQPGDTVTVTAPAGGVTAGLPYAVGQLCGIAVTTAAAGALFELAVTGVWTVPKTSALQIDQGDAVYLDAANFVVNKTSAAQKEFGIATSNAANPSPTVEVLLLPTIRTSVAA